MEILLASHSPRRKELLQTLQVPFSVVQVDCEEVVPEGIAPTQTPQYLSQQKAQAYLQSHTLQADQILLTADTIVLLENQVLGKPTDEQHARWMLQHLSNRTHQVITGVTLAYNLAEGLTEGLENLAEKSQGLAEGREDGLGNLAEKSRGLGESRNDGFGNLAEKSQKPVEGRNEGLENLADNPQIPIANGESPESPVARVGEATQPHILSFACTTHVHFIALTDSQIDYYIDAFRPMDKAGAYGIQEWIGHIGIDHIEGDYLNVMGLPLSLLYKHLSHIPLFARYEQNTKQKNF